MSCKIFIVEDEELYADKLEMLVEKVDYGHYTTMANSRAALAWLQEEFHQNKHPNPIIFFTTIQDDLMFKRVFRTNNLIFKP